MDVANLLRDYFPNREVNGQVDEEQDQTQTNKDLDVEQRRIVFFAHVMFTISLKT